MLPPVRLIYQQTLWRLRYGWTLAPTIPLTPSSQWQIADVATGNAGWPLEMAGQYPESTYMGFDISTAQFPQKEALPSNVMLEEFDIYASIPERLVGRFDVVHVQLLVAGVRDADPVPVLNQLLRMLSMSFKRMHFLTCGLIC